MNKFENIMILDVEKNDFAYLKQEYNVERISYQYELQLLEIVKRGDIEKIEEIFSDIDLNTIYFGKLSNNENEQKKIIAIGFVAILCRAIIEVGVNETLAFDFSDQEMRNIFKINDFINFDEYMMRLLYKFTYMVYQKNIRQYSNYTISAIKYINSHLHNRITLNDLANHINISKEYLCRTFKLDTKESINHYINRQKIELSKTYLIQNKLTIKEIAYTLGYSSESYFIQVFKKIMGMTPEKYIKQIAQSNNP